MLSVRVGVQWGFFDVVGVVKAVLFLDLFDLLLKCLLLFDRLAPRILSRIREIAVPARVIVFNLDLFWAALLSSVQVSQWFSLDWFLLFTFEGYFPLSLIMLILYQRSFQSLWLRRFRLIFTLSSHFILARFILSILLIEHSPFPFELIFIWLSLGLKVFLIEISPGHDESLSDQN